MRRKKLTSQEKYEYIALSWGNIPAERIAWYVQDDISNLHTYVMRMRRKGVPILHLEAKPLTRTDRGKAIDYKKITQLLIEQP